jgi:hypothetical protein
MHQGQPLPGAVALETGHVQRAVVQQFGVLAEAAGLDAVAADELVDVLEARVLAHVGHDPLVARGGDGRALVRGAAQRRALDGRAAGVEGVDLDHPAEAVVLVGVLGGVEAVVELGPAVA